MLAKLFPLPPPLRLPKRQPFSRRLLAPSFRPSSSSSSSRWTARQSRDPYTLASKTSALKSRAAYKLLEIDTKHRLFRPNDTVVDLGYAPGSWSQVALSRTRPRGKVVGIDVIPAMPPRGVSTLQGDFLSSGIRAELREFVREGRGAGKGEEEEEENEEHEVDISAERTEKGDNAQSNKRLTTTTTTTTKAEERRGRDLEEGRVVNVVLSDMSAPWPLESSSWIKSVSNPYLRMMNTSGMAFRDHAGSMDLCLAALDFCYDTLVTGGHFLCKFYQGAEDHALELRLKKLFEKVHRIKPDSSRKESREAYLVGLRRKTNVAKEAVFGDG